MSSPVIQWSEIYDDLIDTPSALYPGEVDSRVTYGQNWSIETSASQNLEELTLIRMLILCVCALVNSDK